ncbi:MAG: Rid family detoxifying hydrolase [Hyphomicrobiaceae bacterium]
MSRYGINSKKLPKAGPYSHAVATRGFVFFSGQVGLDPKSGKLVEGGIAAETRQAFKNVAAVLKEADCDLGDVVKVTVFLTDMTEFGKMNEVYAETFEEPHPARTTIGVAALPMGARVEIEVIAEGGPLTP